MNERNRLLLNRFSDGETDAAEAARARELLAADAEAKAYWQELQRTERLLREAFHPVSKQAIPPRCDGMLRAPRRRAMSRRSMPLAAPGVHTRAA